MKTSKILSLEFVKPSLSNLLGSRSDELEERQRGEYPNRIYILPKGIIIVIPSLVACNLHRRIEKLLKLEPLKKRPRGERNTGSGGDARGGGIKRWVGLKGETTKERRKVVEGG